MASSILFSQIIVEIPLPSSSIVISSTVQEPSFVTSTTTTSELKLLSVIDNKLL